MNVKELKEIIKDLPDEMPVIPAYYGEWDTHYGCHLEFRVEELTMDDTGVFEGTALEVALF